METQASDYEKFDAIVVGAGQAAKPLAIALGQAGWKTAVIERKHLGGSCINFGCTPTKAMAASARVAYLARRAADYGVRTGAVAGRSAFQGCGPAWRCRCWGRSSSWPALHWNLKPGETT